MSLYDFLKTRQAALEQAYAMLREKTASPYTAKVSDLAGMLVVRERLKTIDEVLGEREPNGALERFIELDRQRVAAEKAAEKAAEGRQA